MTHEHPEDHVLLLGFIMMAIYFVTRVWSVPENDVTAGESVKKGKSNVERKEN